MKYLAILGVAGLAIACDSPTPTGVYVKIPPATANAVQFNDRFERVTFFPDLCNGGRIVFQATWHHVVAITLDDAGGFHLKEHYNVHGQGSDPTTGIDYVINDVGNQEVNGRVGFEETYTESYVIVAKGGAPNVTVLIDFHITVTPNGDLTSYHDNFRVRCQ